MVLFYDKYLNFDGSDDYVEIGFNNFKTSVSDENGYGFSATVSEF